MWHAINIILSVGWLKFTYEYSGCCCSCLERFTPARHFTFIACRVRSRLKTRFFANAYPSPFYLVVVMYGACTVSQ